MQRPSGRVHDLDALLKVATRRDSLSEKKRADYAARFTFMISTAISFF
jgi:hypothetical protein